MLKEELEPVVAAFDNLFKTLKMKKTEKGTVFFSPHKTTINNKGGVKYGKPMATDNSRSLQAQIESYTDKNYAKDSYQEVEVSDDYAGIVKKLG